MRNVSLIKVSRSLSMLPVGLLLAAPLASGCGYNSLVGSEEAVKSAWGQVENVYQRRADLVPNLVATVKGSAAHEQNTLAAVAQARAAATQVKVNATELSDPAKLRAFEQAQGQLSQSLGRLLAVTENYPDLKANAGFRIMVFRSYHNMVQTYVGSSYLLYHLLLQSNKGMNSQKVFPLLLWLQ